jgi:small conductance mechanosensitive channel
MPAALMAATSTSSAHKLIQFLIDRPLKVLVLVLLAWIGVRFAHRAIARFVSRLQPEQAREALGILREGSMPDDTAPLRLRRAQRAETVGALLKSAAGLVIWVFAMFAVLNQIGINLGALIAGASILGIAVSFGAQNLVRDFLAGIFVLLEDQYGVGDLIDAGPATGRVEAVSLRSTQLRDIRGTLWHIPNGQVTRIGNFSQGWSQAILDVEVADHVDIEATTALIEQAAAELRDDPALAGRIVDDPQVWGVERISEGSVAIRIAVRTSPRARQLVERQLRAHLKQVLEEHDVSLLAVT